MKKYWMIVLLIFLCSVSKHTVQASEYIAYQDITFNRFGGKLLRHYTEDDYDRLYDLMPRRRFWGWQTVSFLNYEPVTFQKETLYVMVNEGTTPIQKTHSFRMNETRRVQTTTSGSIGINLSGPIKQFRLGLDSKLDIKHMNDITITEEERVEIKLNVDPMTTLRVEVYGEGLVSNGVARYLRFWRVVRQGGYEVFIITTEYYSIVKEAIIHEENPDLDE